MAVKKGKRELIKTGKDSRYVKREQDGTFKESDDVGKSLTADRRTKAKKTVKPGYGDQGDQAKKGTKKAAKTAAKNATKKSTKKAAKKTAKKPAKKASKK